MPAASNGNDARQAVEDDRAARSFRSAAQESTAAVETESDAGLAAELAGIAQEVASQAGIERAGIMGSYSAKVTFARKTMTGPQRAAMLAALKQERSAALKALSQRSAQELKGRMAAARRRRARGRPKGPIVR